NEYAVNYHPLEQAFRTNRAMNNTVRVSQSSAASNFQLSYTRSRNPGTMREAYGALNQSVRVNVDHQLRDNVQLSVGATHGRNYNVPTAAQFNTLFSFDPDVNLLAPGDERGTKYRISPDSGGQTTPLFQQEISGDSTRRTSTQAGANHRRTLASAATGTSLTAGTQNLAAATTKNSSSSISESRLNSWFSSLALDYGGKYIGDFLFRREGSSLYGPRYRYNNF